MYMYSYVFSYMNSCEQKPQVDWWCLGILTFELCSGHPPFESATPMQIYSKAPFSTSCHVVPGRHGATVLGAFSTWISDLTGFPADFQVQKGINKVIFPKKLKGSIETLVKGLCNAVPSHLVTENMQKHLVRKVKDNI